MLEKSCFSEPTTKRIDQRFVTRTHHNGLRDREAINTHDLGRRAPRQRMRIQAVQGRPNTSEPTVQEEQLLVAGYLSLATVVQNSLQGLGFNIRSEYWGEPE